MHTTEKHKPDTTTQKYKIWDDEAQTWYRPTYPGTRMVNNSKPIEIKGTEEILFSQTGEMYMRKNDGQGPDQLTHLNGRYCPCLYTGMKDKAKIKTYVNDVVQNQTYKGKVIAYEGCFGVQVGSAVFPLVPYQFENLGSMLEKPDLL